MSRPRLNARPAAVLLTAGAMLASMIVVPISRGQETNSATSVYLDYSAVPSADHLLAHDLNIIQPNATCDLEEISRNGGRTLAYLSLVEISEDAGYLSEAIDAGVTLQGTNSDWNSRLVEVTTPAWRQFVIEKLARPAIERGFDGIFLDTVDSHRLLAQEDPSRADAYRKATLELIQAIRAEFPDAAVVINRGFDLLDAMEPGTIDGVLIESVFRTFDPKTKAYLPVAPDQKQQLIQKVTAIQALKLPVYIVDYLPPGELDQIEETEHAIRELGAIPFLTTPSLDGTISAGGKIARRILVLFGHDPAEVEAARIWPADTTAYAIFQMPLEYYGYEVDYHDVGKGLPDLANLDDYAGVILDEEIHLPFALEHEFANWLLARLDEQKKVLFLGSYAFSDHHERKRLFDRLGITGNEETGPPLEPAKVLSLDESIMNFEFEVSSNNRDFENLSAPEGSRVLLSLGTQLAAKPTPEAPSTDPIAGRYDAVYLSEWGGAMLSPYVVFEASEETVLQYADPFAFLDPIFPAGKFPAPDPTTRDGLRVFFTHIDGDGFSSLSRVDPGKTCAEVLQDRILRDLPWPITISVVGAEIQGHMLSQPEGQSARLTQIAREIYRLPHVEPASHSYSHPYLWIEDDAEFMGLYDSRNLALKLQAKYPEIDAARETVGSLAYVTDRLAPANKPAELLLWTGNCRPSPEALRALRLEGFENMNGGNTILCKRFPGLFGVAPRTITWDGELQVNAANQNEFMYTNGWLGPTWNGFSQVIETFELTESPRRLKPVNVYYHFYSAERPDAFGALEEIYDWCREQELHATTGLQYARSARDAWQTRLVKTGARRWTTINEGQIRTLRIPAALGTPDLLLSSGLIGFKQQDEVIYLHTNGDRRVTIQLADDPARHARIDSSSASVKVTRLDPEALEIQVQDRPTQLILAGFSPRSSVSVATGNQSETHETDSGGSLRIDSPASTTLTIRQASRR